MRRLDRSGVGLALGLAALAAIAGCLSLAPSATPTPVSPSPTADAPRTPAPTTDTSRTSVPAADPPDNPWRADPIVVAVDAGNATGDVRPLVRDALDFWTVRADATRFSDVRFVLADPPADPDVVVQFVDHIERCDGPTTDAQAGCAELPGADDSFASRPSAIRVETGYDDRSTVTVLQHEFGHALGLDHGAPLDVMNATLTLYAEPQPDLSDRAVPWPDATLSVAFDASALPPGERDAFRTRAGRAVDYLDRGADGRAPPTLAVRRAANRSVADVVVEAAPDRAGSRRTVRTRSVDRDDAPEYYASATVVVGSVPDETVSWHVAHWLVPLGGVDDLPPYLRDDADAETRRGDWWRR